MAKVLISDALSSAAGRYTYVLIHAGLAMGLDF